MDYVEIDFSDDGFDMICDIADRFEREGGKYEPDRMSFIMDMMAANGVNGNPNLRYDRMLHDFDKGSFMHDANGIQYHMDRATGLVGGCFLPRCAA